MNKIEPFISILQGQATVYDGIFELVWTWATYQSIASNKMRNRGAIDPVDLLCYDEISVVLDSVRTDVVMVMAGVAM